ncbi:MAG: FAD-dependent oxidoreductase, partial [Acidobacteriota bacterium]
AGLEAVEFWTPQRGLKGLGSPARACVLGAGGEGCGLAQRLARAGARVDLLERQDRILPREDPEAARLIERALDADGVGVHAAAEARSVERRGEAIRVRFDTSAGEGREIEVDRLVVTAEASAEASGRAPRVADLGLEAAGVEYSVGGGIEVDARLRTTNPRVFAAGSALQLPPRALGPAAVGEPLAAAQARMAVRNALLVGRLRWDSLAAPHLIPTSPAVARVGLQAAEAEDLGEGRVETLRVPLEDPRAGDGGGGFLKIYLKRGGDRILGAALVAEGAAERLAPLTLALTHGIGLSKLAAVTRPDPIPGGLLRRAARQRRLAARRPSLAARLLGAWFRWVA